MNNSNIIDNHKVLMVDAANDFLTYSPVSQFAVGFFYLGGLRCIADRLSQVDEAYPLIGDQPI